MGLDAYLIAVPKGKDAAKAWEDESAEQVAYWRKANQVHRYFIERCVPGGVEPDGYGFALVGSEVLPDLHDRCVKVLEDPALGPDLLPTQPGFFFGPTEYGEFYLQDLRETMSQLEAIRDDPSLVGRDIHYHWWW